MKTPLTFFLIFCVHISILKAQTIEYLDINQVRAGILTHGDMFFNPSTSEPLYEFPKGSGLHSNSATSIWMSGRDTMNVLHVAAQQYRQSGNDYWPGPLDSAGNLNMSTSNTWDKIWKVNQTTIDSFLLIVNHTISNTPPVILQWPAKGNPYATGNGGAPLFITTKMAPFHDVNGDSLYNALDGDYPQIKGEQMLWWVFSDNGPTHDETNAIPFKFEIHAMAYACTGKGLQNTTFYSFEILNKSAVPYHQMRIGVWDDIDLGYAWDDYIGVDTSRRMAIGYNAQAVDPKYGNQLTQLGIRILRSPLDSGSVEQPLGSYMFYKNVFSPAGNPSVDSDFASYMRSTWLDGLHLTHSCTGRAPGASVNFCFTDDPSISSGWSEKTCGNIPDDRRFILSTDDFTFDVGEKRYFEFAVINTLPGTSNANFTALKALADTAKLFAGVCPPLNPSSASNQINDKSIKIYPNPAIESIHVQVPASWRNAGYQVRILNLQGQILVNQIENEQDIVLDTKNLASGLYLIQVVTEIAHIEQLLIKE